MKKFIYSLLIIIGLTLFSVIFLEMIECDPEHGKDEFQTFCVGSIASSLWKIDQSKIGKIIALIIFSIPLLAASMQWYFFDVLMKKIGALKANLLSSLFPIAFGLTLFALNFSKSTEFNMGTISKIVIATIIAGQSINPFIYIYRKHQIDPVRKNKPL